MIGTICQNCMHLNICKYTNKMALVESKCSELFKEHHSTYPVNVILSCECFLCKADKEDGNKGPMPLPKPYKDKEGEA